MQLFTSTGWYPVSVGDDYCRIRIKRTRHWLLCYAVVWVAEVVSAAADWVADCWGAEGRRVDEEPVVAVAAVGRELLARQLRVTERVRGQDCDFWTKGDPDQTE